MGLVAKSEDQHLLGRDRITSLSVPKPFLPMEWDGRPDEEGIKLGMSRE